MTAEAAKQKQVSRGKFTNVFRTKTISVAIKADTCRTCVDLDTDLGPMLEKDVQDVKVRLVGRHMQRSEETGSNRPHSVTTLSDHTQ